MQQESAVSLTAPLESNLPQIDFKDLKSVLLANQQLCQRAMAAMDSDISRANATNWDNIDTSAGDALEAQMNTTRAKGVESVKLNKERRSVYTKAFDEVRALFTKAENDIQIRVDELKGIADKWNGIKAKRAAAIQRENDLKLARENAKVDFAKHIAEQIQARYSENISGLIRIMNADFYSQPVEQLSEFESKLFGFTPTFTPYDYGFNDHPLLTAEEMAPIKANTEAKTFQVLGAAWVEKITTERDRLIACIPARRAELERIATDAAGAKEARERIARERAEAAAKLAQEEADRKAAAESEAAAEKLSNAFETAAIAPAVQLSKGTQVKQKYAPASHKEYIPVIQWWVSNSMHLLTVEELSKKLSFMLTSANKDLNKGNRIEGVPVVEDFSTRTSRK